MEGRIYLAYGSRALRTFQSRGWGFGSVVERLPSKHKALGSATLRRHLTPQSLQEQEKSYNRSNISGTPRQSSQGRGAP